MTVGRFAPSPTGDLHLGNLRTALVAWLMARHAGGGFLVRMEDLDGANASAEHARRQLADLAALGLDWDGEVVFQRTRFDRYEQALGELVAAGLTYECYCTRREIAAAASAPHGPTPDGAYPGTCRDLTAEQRRRRARERPAAVRLRLPDPEAVVVVDDLLAGPSPGRAQDVVLRRNDGVPAYHLAVVVDDADQGVTVVTRGDDLLPSTPSQLVLARLLGLAPVAHAHVPLVVGPAGDRLAKRDGAVTLADLAAGGVAVDTVRTALAASLGLAAPGEPVTAADLLARFDVGGLRDRGRTPVPLADLQRSWS